MAAGVLDAGAGVAVALFGGPGLQQGVDGEGFGGGEVGGEVGHAVCAAAQGDAAFADRGGAALAYAVGVVGGDDAVGVGQDRVASGASAGGEGGQEPVDDFAVDGVAVQGVHGAHVACEQGGGGFVEAAGVHGLDEGGELGDQPLPASVSVPGWPRMAVTRASARSSSMLRMLSVSRVSAPWRRVFSTRVRVSRWRCSVALVCSRVWMAKASVAVRWAVRSAMPSGPRRRVMRRSRTAVVRRWRTPSGSWAAMMRPVWARIASRPGRLPAARAARSQSMTSRWTASRCRESTVRMWRASRVAVASSRRPVSMASTREGNLVTRVMARVSRLRARLWWTP